MGPAISLFTPPTDVKTSDKIETVKAPETTDPVANTGSKLDFGAKKSSPFEEEPSKKIATVMKPNRKSIPGQPGYKRDKPKVDTSEKPKIENAKPKMKTVKKSPMTTNKVPQNAKD